MSCMLRGFIHLFCGLTFSFFSGGHQLSSFILSSFARTSVRENEKRWVRKLGIKIKRQYFSEETRVLSRTVFAIPENSGDHLGKLSLNHALIFRIIYGRVMFNTVKQCKARLIPSAAMLTSAVTAFATKFLESQFAISSTYAAGILGGPLHMFCHPVSNM